MISSRRPASAVRRIVTVGGSLTWLTAVALVLAGPASAAPAVGWGGDQPPEHSSVVHGVLILAGIPVLIAVVLAAFIYLPPLLRGERVAPGAAPVDNQWLGGPRRAAGELAAPDSEKSVAGGGSGRW